MSMADWASVSLPAAAVSDVLPAAERTSLITLFTLVLTDLFRKRRISLCRARFNADL